MTRTAIDVQAYPIAPDVAMGLREKLHVLRVFHTGPGLVRDKCGPVAIIRFRPRRLLPPLAVVTSPQGIRDVLGGSDGSIDKEDTVHSETRAWGDNLFNLPHAKWANRRRAIQPLFTKKHVASFSDHISDAAEALTDSWLKQGSIDLDREIRKLTLRVLGRSIFGIDLGSRADDLAAPLESAQRWVYGRVSRPVRAPGWLPTPPRRKFRAALGAIREIIDEAIASARDNPESGGELIRLLLNSTDPETGRPLTEREISDELFIFVLAGHDTTSTTLTYALWALGRNQQIQEQVAAEVRSLGERPLTVDDVHALPHTVRVIHEVICECVHPAQR